MFGSIEKHSLGPDSFRILAMIFTFHADQNSNLSSTDGSGQIVFSFCGEKEISLNHSKITTIMHLISEPTRGAAVNMAYVASKLLTMF